MSAQASRAPAGLAGVVAVLVVGATTLADVVTTAVGRTQGLTEANPVLRPIINGPLMFAAVWALLVGTLLAVIFARPALAKIGYGWAWWYFVAAVSAAHTIGAWNNLLLVA